MADVIARGIDVSWAQGKIDWAKVAASGAVDFAIFRSGYGWDNDKQIDNQYRANIAGCGAHGIPFGIYHYFYAWSVEDARCEARWLLKLLAGVRPEYPVFWDFEEAFQIGGSNSPGFDPDKQMQMIEAWMEVMEGAGYFAALYSTASAVKRLRDRFPERMKRFAVWVAHVKTQQPMTPGDIWQYSWEGCIDGISGKVDMNYAYRDFPKTIKAAGLNGWDKPAEPPASELPAIPVENLRTVLNELLTAREKLFSHLRLTSTLSPHVLPLRKFLHQSQSIQSVEVPILHAIH